MSSVQLPGAYRLTYRDWLAAAEEGHLYEIIEGELFVTPPPSVYHQRISRDLEHELVHHLKTAGGEVLYAPIGVRLSDDDVLEPDLVVVLPAHADRIGEQAIEGAPDLVIEILSPGSAKRDLGIKRKKYESAGVCEYWIVDPEASSVEVLALERGGYVRHGLFRRADTLTSRLLAGFAVALSKIFRG